MREARKEEGREERGRKKEREENKTLLVKRKRLALMG